MTNIDNESKIVEMFTDSSYYEGKAGLGVVLFYRGWIKEAAKPICGTNPSESELRAILFGLSLIKEPCFVHIYTDQRSIYLSGIKQSSRDNMQNCWREYEKYESMHHIHIAWIRRDTHPHQIRAHEIAQKAMYNG